MRRLGCSIALIAIFASPAFATTKNSCSHDSRPSVLFAKKLPGGRHLLGLEFIHNPEGRLCSVRFHRLQEGKPGRTLVFENAAIAKKSKRPPSGLHLTQKAQVEPIDVDIFHRPFGTVSARSNSAVSTNNNPGGRDRTVLTTNLRALIDLVQVHKNGDVFKLHQLFGPISELTGNVRPEMANLTLHEVNPELFDVIKSKFGSRK